MNKKSDGHHFVTRLLHVSEAVPNTQRSRGIFQSLIRPQIRTFDDHEAIADWVPNILFFARDILIHHNSS